MQEKLRIDAIVLGANYANALGMVKSVGEAGFRCGLIHQTSILNKKNETPDMASRYVWQGKYVDRKNDEELLAAILTEFRQEDFKPVLLAADDYSDVVVV